MCRRLESVLLVLAIDNSNSDLWVLLVKSLQVIDRYRTGFVSTGIEGRMFGEPYVRTVFPEPARANQKY